MKKFQEAVVGGSPPIRMVPPAVAFLLGCTSGGTVSVYSKRTHE